MGQGCKRRHLHQMAVGRLLVARLHRCLRRSIVSLGELHGLLGDGRSVLFHRFARRLMVNSHRTARAVVGLIVIENAVGYGMCVRGVFRGLVAVGFRLVVVTIHVPVSKLSVDMGRSRGSLVIEVVAGFRVECAAEQLVGWPAVRTSTRRLRQPSDRPSYRRSHAASGRDPVPPRHCCKDPLAPSHPCRDA